MKSELKVERTVKKYSYMGKITVSVWPQSSEKAKSIKLTEEDKTVSQIAVIYVQPPTSSTFSGCKRNSTLQHDCGNLSSRIYQTGWLQFWR